jgi:hypothetical protein
MFRVGEIILEQEPLAWALFSHELQAQRGRWAAAGGAGGGGEGGEGGAGGGHEGAQLQARLLRL